MSAIHVERETGIVFVLSAPSGAGKTTLSDRLLKRVDGMTRSVSCSTRKPRRGETDGVDYHFITRAKFQEMVDRDEFIEWANVHGALYGTPLSEIKRVTKQERKDIILVIDIQGAATLRRKEVINLRSVFLLPPSVEELERRIRERGADSEESIRQRMANSVKEFDEMRNFDYIVVNANLDEALDQLESIVTAERLRVDHVIVNF